MDIEEIRDKLELLRLERVAQATGVHYNTLRNMRDNSDANPTRKNMDIIERYLTEVLG